MGEGWGVTYREGKEIEGEERRLNRMGIRGKERGGEKVRRKGRLNTCTEGRGVATYEQGNAKWRREGGWN